MQTVEGKLAVGEVAAIQTALTVFGILTACGVLHPSAQLAAEIVGAGQALVAWITTNFVKNRTALKSGSVTTKELP